MATTIYPAMGIVPNDSYQADPSSTTFYGAMGLFPPEEIGPTPPPVVSANIVLKGRMCLKVGLGIGFSFIFTLLGG